MEKAKQGVDKGIDKARQGMEKARRGVDKGIDKGAEVEARGREQALTAAQRLANAANALFTRSMPREAVNPIPQRQRGEPDLAERDVFDFRDLHEDRNIIDGEGGVFIDAEALLPDDGAGWFRRRASVVLSAAASGVTTEGGDDDDEQKDDIDDDEEDDATYVEDMFAKNRKREKFTEHSGYIYIKEKSNLAPFLYRRYFCILKKGAGPGNTGNGDELEGAMSIQYWRSRLAYNRLMFNPRANLTLRPESYTTDITRVRGLKIDLRGGEDFRRNRSDKKEKEATVTPNALNLGRRYLDKSLGAMRGSGFFSCFTGLKWFQFRAGENLHAFTVQVDGETSPFRRQLVYFNQIIFASESLPRLMRWRRAITEAILEIRELNARNDKYGDNDVYGSFRDRCMQGTCSAMHLAPTTVLMHALVAKRSQHLKITLPPAFSPVHYFVHAVVCSIAYTTCCEDEIKDQGGGTFFPRHSLWDFAVIDKGIPAEFADMFLTGWHYDDQFDGPRLVVYYKIIQKSREMAARTGRVAESPKNKRKGGTTDEDTDDDCEDSYLHVIFGVRGTVPADPEDLADDLLIMRGMFTSKSKRCKYFKSKLKEVKEKYQKIIDTHDGGNLEGLRNKKVPRSMKVTVTGHSLGGLVAYLVGNENECYIYNMASSMFQGVERKSATIKKAKSVPEHVHEVVKSMETTFKDEVTSRADPKTIAGMFQGITSCLPFKRVPDDDDDNVYDDADFAYGEGGAMNGVPEEETGTPSSSPTASGSGSPKSGGGGGGTKVYHFAPFSDDIAANARIRTHWIPQYVAGHPHILPNHFRHAVRLIQEMRRVSMIDTEYLQPRNLLRATALPATHRSVEDMSKAAKDT